MHHHHGCHSHAPLPRPRLDGVDPAAMRAFESFMRAMHVQRHAAARGLERGGSSFAQMAYLRLLAANDGITQRELARELQFSKPTVTAALTALEREGLLERRADERDRRLTRVFLTEEGRAREERLRAHMATFVTKTFGAMPVEDAERLSALLDELTDRVGEVLQEMADACERPAVSPAATPTPTPRQRRTGR